MIVVCALLLGLVLGLASGGSLGNLLHERIRGETFLLVVLVGQVLAPMLAHSANLNSTGYYLWLASFVGMACVALANIGRIGFPAVLAGTLLNLLVITVNGTMPVSGYSINQAGYPGNPVEALGQGGLATHTILGSQTQVAILADVMPLSGPRLLESVVSIGDVLLVVGVIAFLVHGMQETSTCRERNPDSGKAF